MAHAQISTSASGFSVVTRRQYTCRLEWKNKSISLYSRLRSRIQRQESSSVVFNDLIIQKTGRNNITRVQRRPGVKPAGMGFDELLSRSHLYQHWRRLDRDFLPLLQSLYANTHEKYPAPRFFPLHPSLPCYGQARYPKSSTMASERSLKRSERASAVATANQHQDSIIFCLQPRRRPALPTALETLLRASPDVPKVSVTCGVPSVPNDRAGAGAQMYVT